MAIPFNKPYCSGRELKYIEQVCHSTTMSGNGEFTKKCHRFFEEKYGFKKVLLCTSGTDALEMCAMLCDLKPGDEVIVPSYTFVSTALCFLRERAKVVFADSGVDNPNITLDNIKPLVTPRTKVIAVVHYAGVACNKDCQVVVAYPKDAHRRAVSICNDVYESTGRITTCCFDYPVANVITDELVSDKDVKFTVNHNDIKIYYNNTTRIYGESNNEICSDIGNDGTTALHGKDLFNPEVTLAIYGCLKVESKGGEIQFSCHEGDTSIGKMKYSLIVKRVKDYINSLGGFEKFAEWGYLRPLVRE